MAEITSKAGVSYHRARRALETLTAMHVVDVSGPKNNLRFTGSQSETPILRRPMTVIKRAQARLEGMKHYFTGKPCIRGHFAPRWCSTRECTQCHREDSPAEMRALRKKESYRETNRLRMRRKREEDPSYGRGRAKAKNLSSLPNPHKAQ